jgi:hypothetical protein
VFENEKTKQTSLVFRLSLDDTDDAARFFGQYSEALEMKYPKRSQLFRRPNFFQFQTESGGVYLRCVATTCLTVESASRDTFDKIDQAVGWQAAPTPPISDAPAVVTQLLAAPSAP